jgi:phosphoribosylanthranilate isomerase
MTPGSFNDTKQVLQSYLSFEYLAMQQDPLVYVSRITNLSDARYCAGMGVNMLGFMVDTSDPDYVSPETYQQLVGWVTGPERVVEMGAAPFDESLLREQYAPQYLHITSSRLNEWPRTAWKLIVEVSVDSLPGISNQLKSREDIAFILVPDLNSSLSNQPVKSIPLLSGAIPAQGSVLAHLEQTGASGIVLHGSRESAPGLTDYDHLSRVLEELNP